MGSAPDKQKRFERLAEKRVTETIKKLRLVGNLANRHNYAYTEDHVKQILNVLELEMRALRQKFSGQREEDGGTFRFKINKRDPKSGAHSAG